MKIYTFRGAPNPKRVRVYLAEKGLDIELVEVKFLEGEHRSPEFCAKNPMAAVPVLELDDGRCFSESVAIIEYLEELHPEPPMIGTTPEERLRVRMLERIAEVGALANVAVCVQNSHPFFAKSVVQTEGARQTGEKRLYGTLKVLDGLIGEGPFVAGDRVTIADCTLYAALWFADTMGLEIDLAKRPNLERFNERFRARPSARA